jgi:tetratricopeptide (TPR) repeat protein
MSHADAENKNYLAIAVALAVCTLLAFYPVVQNGFINFDDQSYITSNNYVKEGLSRESIVWAFSFSNHTGHYWHPLTWLSLMLDYELFKLNPIGYHLVNLLLHIANSLLLFTILRKMTGRLWCSAFVAALFALHPLNVETVAWAVERKSVLSSLFWMLAIMAYLRYVEKPSPARYVPVVLFLAVGLMAKSMLVSLPAVLLLLDFWPLRRIQILWGPNDGRKPFLPLLLEKVPLLILSVLSVAVSIISVKISGVETHITSKASMADRIANALVSYVAYPVKLAWPTKLAIYYPLQEPYPLWQPLCAALLLAAISIAAFYWAKQRPWLITGWFWYLGVLFPVTGIMRAGIWPAMADRFTYLPFIGLFIILAWGGAELAEKMRLPNALPIGTLAVILTAFALLTNLQARRWHDSITLFSHVAAVTTNNDVAHKNLGAALANQGRFDEALWHVNESLRIRPDPLEYVSQGWLHLQLGKYQQAAESCRNALALDPNNDKGHFLLGLAMLAMGNYPAVQEEYSRLKMLNSSYAPRLLSEFNQPHRPASAP